jgi:hypothetical protein
MANRGPRNQLLLAQLAATNPFKETAPRIFEIGTAFDRDIEAIGLDRRLSQEGKAAKAKERGQEALRALDDVQKPIDDHRKQTESMRSGMKAPTYDKTDIVAAMNRRELRDRSLTMTFGQRQMRMVGPHRDEAFRDAVLEMPPWVSGFNEFEPNELKLYEEAKEEQRRDLNGELMTALEARAGVEAEIMMVINIVTNDLESDATDLASRAA